MANEVFAAISTLMAVREFDDRELPDDVVWRILEAARLTASASNQQAWHFVVVRDRQALRQLGSLIRTGPYIASAAAAVVVAYEKDKGVFGISDGSRAIQSMMLAAWGEGVASNWTGFAERMDSVRKEFGLPDTYDVLAVMPLGYPKRRVVGKKKRKQFNQVVSSERFGEHLT